MVATIAADPTGDQARLGHALQARREGVPIDGIRLLRLDVPRGGWPVTTLLTMARIEETRLPGIGLRHDLAIAEGTRIGVITYDAGGRELVIYDERDPDECRATLTLDEDDARALADLLGGSQVVEHLDRHRSDPAG